MRDGKKSAGRGRRKQRRSWTGRVTTSRWRSGDLSRSGVGRVGFELGSGKGGSLQSRGLRSLLGASLMVGEVERRRIEGE
jgi:hypothetical protein